MQRKDDFLCQRTDSTLKPHYNLLKQSSINILNL